MKEYPEIRNHNIKNNGEEIQSQGEIYNIIKQIKLSRELFFVQQ